MRKKFGNLGTVFHGSISAVRERWGWGYGAGTHEGEVDDWVRVELVLHRDAAHATDNKGGGEGDVEARGADEYVCFVQGAGLVDEAVRDDLGHVLVHACHIGLVVVVSPHHSRAATNGKFSP